MISINETKNIKNNGRGRSDQINQFEKITSKEMSSAYS